MTSSPSDPAAVAVELERLRRSIDVGFTRTDGALALLVQRHDQTEQRLTEHTARFGEFGDRLDMIERGEAGPGPDHEKRLRTLERARWPLPSIAAVMAIAGFLLSLWRYT